MHLYIFWYFLEVYITPTWLLLTFHGSLTFLILHIQNV